jgi:hypothetical protein
MHFMLYEGMCTTPFFYQYVKNADNEERIT